MKNRQALHEIIWVSSLSIIFVEFSFKPVYPTMVVKNFKFMKNYNFWKMYLLASQNIDSRYFYSYATTVPLPIPPITPAVMTLLLILSSPLRRR